MAQVSPTSLIPFSYPDQSSFTSVEHDPNTSAMAASMQVTARRRPPL